MADRRRSAVWSPEARADVSEIWDYYAKRAGRDAADKLIRDIGNTARLIEDHPYGGVHATKYDQESDPFSLVRMSCFIEYELMFPRLFGYCTADATLRTSSPRMRLTTSLMEPAIRLV